MIAKSIEGSITKKNLKELILRRREYEQAYTGVLIRNDGLTMINLIFKSINPAIMISVSNLKYEIEKSSLAKFGNNVKPFLMICPQIALSLLIK